MATQSKIETKSSIPVYAWYALFLLTFIYVMNFVDRVLIYILFTPIKKELQFSDLELALLGATSFVIFYTALGIPFGRMADKVSRKKLIAFGLTVWSIFSGLTGFATGFWTIFSCRMLVGIGEASLGPAALSLLSDYFPSKMRATVQAIFSSGIAIGTGVAFFFGGWISDALSWRYAFYFLGFPGLIFVVLILFLKEPQRGISDAPKEHQKKNWKLLFQNVPLRYILVGYVFFAVSANSVSIWIPTFLVRTQKMAISEIGLLIGIGTIIGGLPGTILGGWFADKFKAKRIGGRLQFTSIIAFLCIPVWLVLLNTSILSLQIICITILLALTLSWLGPAAADVNDIAVPYLRGLAVGLYFFTVNVIGYGIAPPIFGKINDLLKVSANPEIMRVTLLLAPLAALTAGIILYKASKSLEQKNMMQTDWLAKWAYYTPNKFFLREYNRNLEWTFLQFNQRTNALANYLTKEIGIKEGEKIAVFSKNRAEYVLLFLACIKCGAILVPLNFRLTPRELDILIKDADPNIFYYEDEYSEKIKELQTLKNISVQKKIETITPFLTDEVNEKDFSPARSFTNDNLVMILYTAGTTGLPKGVMINHQMLFWNAINTGLRLDLNSQDHTQSYAPFFHTGGWNVLFTPFLLHGGSHTLLQNFDAELILKLMEKERTTILFGVPTMLQMMSDLEYFKRVDLSSVRYAIVGGAPMPIPLINTWHEKGVYIRQGYGLTEVGPNCFSLHQDDAIRKKGSIGFPNFYVEPKIVAESGSECGNNEVGELWMKSPVVTPGYWRKEKETLEAITDGFFHTGDLVMRDDDGYYFVVDRKKNMYISGGENVYPAEIEKILYTNDHIKEAAVIGVPDEKWGEVGKAFIVLNSKNSLDENAVLDYCKGNLAKYKIPKYVQFLDTLPKTDAGKIDKKKLLKIHQQIITS